MDKREFEYKFIPALVREILKEYDLDNTFDRDNPINTDLGLAKDFYEAGFDFALRSGLYCPDTGRRVIFDENEIRDAVARAPISLTIGYGPDKVTIRSRKPEDGKVPVAEGSALGMAVSEKYFIPLCMAIAQYRVIDIILAPTLDNISGYEVRSRTPFETVMGMYEARLVKEALWRVGRPGMPLHGVEGAPTEYGYFGGFLWGGFDPDRTIGIALIPEPITLPYSILHRVAVSLLTGAPLEAGHMLSIGGYFGPPEGAVLGSIAAQILQAAAMFPTIVESTILDARYFCNTTREALWATSVSMQARTLKNKIMNLGITSQVAGPCTDMLLYETVTITLADSVSGVSIEIGTRPTGCRYRDYGSGLENKFFAEVLKSSAKHLKLSDANEIVKSLLPKYENKLKTPPKGKPFYECTNLKTLQPTREWLDIYEKVWRELEDLGLPRWEY